MPAVTSSTWMTPSGVNNEGATLSKASILNKDLKVPYKERELGQQRIGWAAEIRSSCHALWTNSIVAEKQSRLCASSLEFVIIVSKDPQAQLNETKVKSAG